MSTVPGEGHAKAFRLSIKLTIVVTTRLTGTYHEASYGARLLRHVARTIAPT